MEKRFISRKMWSGRHHWYCVIVIISTVVVIQSSSQTTRSSSLPAETRLPPASTALPVIRPNPETKLKVCSDDESRVMLQRTRGRVTIPTFSSEKLEYLMEEYELDKNPSPNVTKVVSRSETIVSKSDYDQEIQFMSVFELLRSATFLLDNGYLSVGDSTLKTAEYYAPNEFCLVRITEEGLDTVAEFRTSRSPAIKRPQLRKCCPLGMVIGEGTCMGYDPKESWSPTFLDVKTGKLLPLAKVNPVYNSPQISCDKKTEDLETWTMDDCNHEFHPTTDSKLAYIGAYRSWEFFNDTKLWCVDIMLIEDGNETREIDVLYHCGGKETKNSNGKDQARVSLLYMINMYIGAFFHFLTTLVYLVIWPKQNIHGKTLCSCTASLFFMQIFMGTAHFLGLLGKRRQTDLCVANSFGGHYFMLASFTWLLVVNFDLWRTFRSIRTEGGKSLKRFLCYSALGWGFPLLVTVISVTLNYTFPCRTSRVPSPEYGDYYCFVAPWAQGIFVYYIMSVLIAMSFVFAGLTLGSLYMFKKEAVNLRSNKRAADQQHVLLFLKLGVVMGLTWIFEVISWAVTRDDENHVIWIICDLYNALSAILIFVIFVCKVSTLTMLEQCVPILKGVTAAFSKLSSTLIGDFAHSDNTASTAAGDSTRRKISTEQAPTVVRYTKQEPVSGEPKT